MKHYFQTQRPDLPAIQKRLVMFFKEREFEVNAAEADGEYLLQAKKTGTWRTLTGTNQAFKIKLFMSEESPDEFVFESTVGAWTSNLTGAGITAMFTGGLTLLTGAAGVAWAMKTERDVVEYLETSLKFRKTKSVDDKGIITKAAPTAGSPSIPSTATPVIAQPASPPAPAATTPYERAMQWGQTELKKLQAAHDAGILDADEFAAKKKDLAVRAGEQEVRFAVEDRSAKLRAAVEAGVLEQHEYEAKVAALEPVVRAEVQAARKQRQNQAQISKLRTALESGVLSQEEYDAKVAALG